MDLTTTIEADSTQVNADDLTGAPRTVTITGVSKGTAEQPVNFELAEFPGRAYRPCKSMRRVMVMAWGPDAAAYVGRRLTLFNDQTVKWAGQSVGGVRIKAMSHISKQLKVALTESRGKRAPFVVDVLPDEPPPTPKQPTPADITKAFKALGVTPTQLEARIGAPTDDWTAADITSLQPLWKSIKAGETTIAAEFDTTEPVQGELA